PHPLAPPHTPTLFPYTTLFRSHPATTATRPIHASSLSRLENLGASVAAHDRQASGSPRARPTSAPQRRKPGTRPGFLGPSARIQDRKSTRLNSSHVKISYAVFC